MRRSAGTGDIVTPAVATPYAVCVAGIVPVRRSADGWRLLVLRARGEWDFPKGQIEDGEMPLEAALRETKEETGITDLELEFGDTWCDTPPYSGGKIARYYLAVTAQEQIALPISPELGRPEHDEWRWVDFDEAVMLVRARVVPVLAWARERLGHGMRPSGEA
jgi:8-oxo-dGTP pyrophosphatase MutT (NUDIX family)